MVRNIILSLACSFVVTMVSGVPLPFTYSCFQGIPIFGVCKGGLITYNESTLKPLGSNLILDLIIRFFASYSIIYILSGRRDQKTGKRKATLIQTTL